MEEEWPPPPPPLPSLRDLTFQSSWDDCRLDSARKREKEGEKENKRREGQVGMCTTAILSIHRLLWYYEQYTVLLPI